MELTYEEYVIGKSIMEESLRLDDDLFDLYVNENVKKFMDSIDFSKLDERAKARQFLSYVNTCYVNIMLNKELYFLGEREDALAERGVNIIHKIIDDYYIEKQFK